jgi:hypothetical protein
MGTIRAEGAARRSQTEPCMPTGLVDLEFAAYCMAQSRIKYVALIMDTKYIWYQELRDLLPFAFA